MLLKIIGKGKLLGLKGVAGKELGVVVVWPVGWCGD